MPAAGQAHEPAGGGFDDAAVDYDGAARSFDEAARTIGEIRNVPVTACQVRLTHGGYDTQRTSQDPEVVSRSARCCGWPRPERSARSPPRPWATSPER